MIKKVPYCSNCKKIPTDFTRFGFENELRYFCKDCCFYTDRREDIEIYPVIFLDFDGVLNDPYWLYREGQLCRKLGGFEFDEKRIEVLRKICYQTEAKLVLSSSWNSRKGVKELFEDEGFEVVGQLGYYKNRGEAIKQWLKDHSQEYSDRFYLILDDETEELSDSQKDHLVYTGAWRYTWTHDDLYLAEHLVGLSEAHFWRAVELLRAQKDMVY